MGCCSMRVDEISLQLSWYKGWVNDPDIKGSLSVKTKIIQLAKMKILLPVILAHVGIVRALPSNLERDIYVPCNNGLYDTAYCCSLGILGEHVKYVPP